MSAYQKAPQERSYRSAPEKSNSRDGNAAATTRGRHSGGANLDPATRALLEPRFGHNLGNIRIYSDAQADRLSQRFDAAAFTVGQDIFFAQGNYAPDSAIGQRLLTHEVAHTVQQRNVGRDHFGVDDLLNFPVVDRSARSETEAHAATEAIRGGKTACLSTNASAAPVISRWESGEHKRAVDEAVENLPADQQVDPAVAAQMQAPIKLANGMMVTPGQITAMMGDFYGRFDKDGNFDPAKSFEQLNNADPKEMAKLVAVIDREATAGKEGKAIETGTPSELEGITRNRRNGDMSYLELAEKNKSHFSAESNEGTNNNLGAYSAFHKMALEKAAQGDMEAARALEASSMHYLTDRHSAGHNFDKDAAEKASGHDPGGVLANMAVKTAHDDMNKNGIKVGDGNGGPGWTAYGDGNWARDENKDNRQHTAQSVYTSYSELQKVAAAAQQSGGTGEAAAADIATGGYSALKTAPQWDPKNQERADAVARNASLPGMLWDYGADAPGGIWGRYIERPYGKIENGLGDAYHWAGDKINEGLEWAGDKANRALDAGGKAMDWADKKIDKGLEWADETVDDAFKAGGKAVDWAGDKADEGLEWAGDKAGRALEAGDEAADWAGDKVKGAWDWVTN